MKAVRPSLLLGVILTLMVLSISPGVNSSAPINSGTELAQGWPLPPKPKASSSDLALMAQGWPLPPKPKVSSSDLVLMAQGWPLPPKPKASGTGLEA